jgi:hypothetical protein
MVTWYRDQAKHFIQLNSSVNRPTVIQLKQYSNRRHRILQLKVKHKSLFKKRAENILHFFIHKSILLNVSWPHFHDNCDIHFHVYSSWNTLDMDCFRNVVAHAQKPDFVFLRNGRVNLNRQGRQFSRLLAAEVCVSVVVMLDTPCSEVMWRVLAAHSIRQFPLHFHCRAWPCAITFQLGSTCSWRTCHKNLRG